MAAKKHTFFSRGKACDFLVCPVPAAFEIVEQKIVQGHKFTRVVAHVCAEHESFALEREREGGLDGR
jgi:hypothetical protein